MAQQPEKRMSTQFLNEFMHDKHWQTRVWLGPTPPGEDANLYMTTGRWADAIIFEQGMITIIEFKLDPDPKAVGQLQLYKQMFDQTIRFNQYWGLPINMMLVTTRIDDHVKELCDTAGIEYRIFRPDWIQYWEKQRFRITTP